MTLFEKVEKLRQRANVSYDEAKAALEASGEDLLDAMIYLEQKGKVPSPPQGGSFTTLAPSPSNQQGPQHSGGYPDTEQAGFSTMLQKFWQWCKKIWHLGNTNHLQVTRKGGVLLTLPLTLVAVCLLFGFWAVGILLIVGLFMDCQYRFLGPDMEKTPANNIMDGASAAAESIKDEVKKHTGNDRE